MSYFTCLEGAGRFNLSCFAYLKGFERLNVSYFTCLESSGKLNLSCFTLGGSFSRILCVGKALGGSICRILRVWKALGGSVCRILRVWKVLRGSMCCILRVWKLRTSINTSHLLGFGKAQSGKHPRGKWLEFRLGPSRVLRIKNLTPKT